MLNDHVTQSEFADLVGISQQAVSALLMRGTLSNGDTARQWLHDYCENLREQAAGRASTGSLDLVQERARLAKEQADKVAMSNQQLRLELAPVSLLEYAIARVGRQIAGVLEAIPVQLKRSSANITADDLRIITAEIIKARNMAASIEINLDELNGSDAIEEGDQARLIDA
jgi:phage terminase Nu1 subunit (DNA packaging protein)